MKCSNNDGSGSKVNFETVGKSNANYTTDIRNLVSDPMDLATNEELSGNVATNIDKPSSSSGAQRKFCGANLLAKDRILKNLLDRVSQLYYPFLLPEHPKADNK
ncbi:hypothetical protein Tco_1115249, partial [Tanacetum coccineum]